MANDDGNTPEDGGSNLTDKVKGGFKTFFFGDDKEKGGDGKADADEGDAPATSRTTAAAPRIATAPRTATRTGGVRPEIRDLLLGKIGRTGHKAYAAFSAQLAALADIIPDEPTRIKAALRTVSTSGFTAEQVLADLEGCLITLDDEQSSFRADLSRKLRDDVGGREQSAADKRSEAEELRSRAAACDEEAAKLLGEAASARAECEAVTADYEATQQELRDGFSSLREVIGRSGA